MDLINVKSMIVVLVTAFIMFALLKPVFLRFMDPGDFDRRRILWLVQTAAGFVSPNIWIYLLVAMPVLLWAASKDSNPIALWLFSVFVVPPVSVVVSLPLINNLFPINQTRALGLFLLFPLVVQHLRTSTMTRTATMKVMDTLLIGYVAYQFFLAFPYDNMTGNMRRVVTLLLDTFLVYFAFSRAITDKRRLVDVMAGLCLAAAVIAPLALFENQRGWLLYTGINDAWGSSNVFAWLLRGDSLRSQLSTGHAITMGYTMATALAFWLYLRHDAKGMRMSWAVVPLLGVAILVSYSRGDWLMALLLPVLTVSLSPTRSGAEFKALLGVALLAVGIYASPLGSRLVDLLPFVGSAEQGTVDYRTQLAETSWRLVQQNPVFGNPFAYAQMENLRQGQGIIDMANAYAGVAVFQGLVGLFLYAGVLFTAVAGAYGRMRQARHESEDLAYLGAVLVACMVATLVFLATAPGAWFLWALAGILAAYSGVIEYAPSVAPVPPGGGRFTTRYARG